MGKASLNRMGAALNSLSKRGFTSVDDVLELRNHIEGNLDAYVELGTAKGDAAGDAILDGFGVVLDYMRGRRAAEATTAAIREERAGSRPRDGALDAQGAVARIREYLNLQDPDAETFRNLPLDASSEAGIRLGKFLGELSLDEDMKPLTGDALRQALDAELPTAAVRVLRTAYKAVVDDSRGAAFQTRGTRADAAAWARDGFDRDFFQNNFNVWSNGKWKPELSKAEIEKVLFPAEASRKGEDIVDGAPLCTV